MLKKCWNCDLWFSSPWK